MKGCLDAAVDRQGRHNFDETMLASSHCSLVLVTPLSAFPSIHAALLHAVPMFVLGFAVLRTICRCNIFPEVDRLWGWWFVCACRSLLLQYGFWRLVLDEAQLVASSSSVAALMTSALWRRHAWVVTGTPITSRVEEIQVLPLA